MYIVLAGNYFIAATLIADDWLDIPRRAFFQLDATMGYPDETEAEEEPMSHSTGLNLRPVEVGTVNSVDPGECCMFLHPECIEMSYYAWNSS